MIYLILDTNIWIYLANGFNSITNNFSAGSSVHFELFDKLKQKTDNKEFVILTNYIIRLEWKRNRKSAARNIMLLESARKEKIASLVSQKNKLGDAVFRQECKKINDSYNKTLQLNAEHIENIEKFLKSCIEVPVSDKVKLELAHRAIDKNKAPFLSGKNNFADAAILLSAAEYLKENMDVLSHAVFVSNNHNEFGSSALDDAFHDDLKDDLHGINIDYHKHLNNLLDLTEELQYAIEAFYEYQQEHDYYFSCLLPDCKTKSGFASFGYLKKKVRVSGNAEQPADQLLLFDPAEINPITAVKYVLQGICTSCRQTHVQCPGCCTLLIDINDDNFYFCNQCEKGFKMLISVQYEDEIIYEINENEFHL